ESATLLTALQQAKLPSTGDAPKEEFADRLLRILKEKNGKKLEAAQLHLVALTKLDKSSPDLLLALGSFFNQREEYGEAIPVLMRAVELAPNSIYAHEQLSF